jgi:hypothetical protein
MSALPKAVRAQVDRANQIAEEYYKGLKQQSAPSTDPPAGSGETPAGSPPADPAVPPTAGTPGTPPTELPKEGYEQKYKVLQGKYNAEVPRLQTQVRELIEQNRNIMSQLTTTQNLLASLSAQRGADPAQQSQGTPPVAAKLVKDEEVREFGPDLIDVMRRVVREEQAALLPEIDRRVAPVAQRIDQVAQTAQQVGARVAQNDHQSVLITLAQAVPHWQEQNEDPGFLEWLDGVDPFAGVRRGVLLQQAYKAHDGPRVVAFFTGYQKEHAVVTPPAAQPPAAAAAAPQKSLEQFVAPGTPKTGAASTPNGSGKRVWSRAEIAKFYADVQAGRFKTNPDQRKALEADIFAAQREGRIR